MERTDEPPRTVFREALESARAKLLCGELEEAERTAKALSALVRAERDVAELERSQPEEDDEPFRAELRRRLARYTDAARTGAPVDVLERIARTGNAE